MLPAGVIDFIFFDGTSTPLGLVGVLGMDIVYCLCTCRRSPYKISY